MKLPIVERLKKKIRDCSTEDDREVVLSYPESGFKELNQAGLSKPFTTRIPVSTIKVLEMLTEVTGESRSEVVNELILEAVNKITDDESMKDLKEKMVKSANHVIQEELKKMAPKCKTGQGSAKRNRSVAASYG